MSFFIETISNTTSTAPADTQERCFSLFTKLRSHKQIGNMIYHAGYDQRIADIEQCYSYSPFQ